MRRWGTAIALAYWHLPLILIVGLTVEQTLWTWLAVLALIPWIGMASPCVFVSIAAALLLLPGVAEGQPADWLTPDVSMIILLGSSLVLFATLYWFVISRAVRPGRWRKHWRVVLVIWTLIGNLGMAFMPPRTFAPSHASQQNQALSGGAESP